MIIIFLSAVNNLLHLILESKGKLPFSKSELFRLIEYLSKILEKYTNDVMSLTKKAENAWRRFKLDPAQLSQAFLGATVGAFSIYDAIQNAAFAVRQFIVDGVNLPTAGVIA